MTPARLAEIRAYIARLDLNQLPGWTVEQRIIADLWETLPDVWDAGWEAGMAYADPLRPWKSPTEFANPYRDGEQP